MNDRRWVVAAVSLALCLLQGSCTAAPGPTPLDTGRVTSTHAVATEAELDVAVSAFLAEMQGYNVLRLRDLAGMLAHEPEPFLLDVREISEVEENGHIPGAVVIPLRELADRLNMLPPFDRTVVSYCGEGWRCTIAMTALGTLGWHRVLSLQDGSFAGYRQAGYEVATGLPAPGAPLDAAQPDPTLVSAVDQMLSGLPQGWGAISADDLVQEMDENPELILLDARTQAEIDLKGAIEGENMLTIPIEEIVAHRAEWPKDHQARIVVYSGSGHRGSMVMAILRIYGYTNVGSLWGGLGAWVEAGYPVLQVTAP